MNRSNDLTIAADWLSCFTKTLHIPRDNHYEIENLMLLLNTVESRFGSIPIIVVDATALPPPTAMDATAMDAMARDATATATGMDTTEAMDTRGAMALLTRKAMDMTPAMDTREAIAESPEPKAIAESPEPTAIAESPGPKVVKGRLRCSSSS